ncbi:hypothetical protein ONS96_012430 [Cadophora gregata f. sp. sojae]|nr:hypothetical protein ONS96_012430 [Cadophora gregata f. sp. sojae]
MHSTSFFCISFCHSPRQLFSSLVYADASTCIAHRMDCSSRSAFRFLASPRLVSVNLNQTTKPKDINTAERKRETRGIARIIISNSSPVVIPSLIWHRTTPAYSSWFAPLIPDLSPLLLWLRDYSGGLK